MSTIHHPPAAGNGEGYECWADALEFANDFNALLRWAVASLPSAQVPCQCPAREPGSCLRCEVELITERRGTKKECGGTEATELPF